MDILSMRGGCLSSVVLALLLLMGGVVVTAWAAETGSFEELTLTLSTETPHRLPLQPIAITVELRNDAPGPIRGHLLLESGCSLLHFALRRGAGDFKPFFSANASTVETEAQPAIIEPGQRYLSEEILSYSWGSDVVRKPGFYIFPEAGQYQIIATLDDLDRSAQIRSNVLDITVRHPGGIDAEALAYLREKQHRVNLLLRSGLPYPSEESDTIIGELETIVDKYHGSVYAKYAAYTLGWIYFFGDDSGGLVGPDRGPEAAPAMFRRVLEYPRFFLTDDALRELVKHYSRRGDLEKARSYVQELESMFPASDMTRAAQLILREAEVRAGLRLQKEGPLLR